MLSSHARAAPGQLLVGDRDPPATAARTRADDVLDVEDRDAGLDAEHAAAVRQELEPRVAVDAAVLVDGDVERQAGVARMLEKAGADLRLLLRAPAHVRQQRAAAVADVDLALLVRLRERLGRVAHEIVAHVAGHRCRRASRHVRVLAVDVCGQFAGSTQRVDAVDACRSRNSKRSRQ